MLTVANIADRLGIDDDTVRGWLATKQLRGVNVAKNPNGKKARWRVRETDLEAFLERRATGQPSPASTPRRETPKRAGNVIEFF